MDGRDLGRALKEAVDFGCGLIIFLALALVVALATIGWLVMTR